MTNLLFSFNQPVSLHKKNGEQECQSLAAPKSFTYTQNDFSSA
jgi:hypothetical protein